MVSSLTLTKKVERRLGVLNKEVRAEQRWCFSNRWKVSASKKMGAQRTRKFWVWHKSHPFNFTLLNALFFTLPLLFLPFCSFPLIPFVLSSSIVFSSTPHLPHVASKCKTFTPFEVNTWFYNFISGPCVSPHCIMVCVFFLGVRVCWCLHKRRLW